MSGSPPPYRPSRTIVQPAKDIPRDAQGRPILPKPKRRNAAPEAAFQKAVVGYLRLALPPQSGIFWSATLNGHSLPTEAAKRKAKERGLNPGVFDLVFIVLDPGRTALMTGDTYWLELKAPKGRLTDEQTVLMEALWPHRGASAKTLDQVAAALTSWGFPIRAHP